MILLTLVISLGIVCGVIAYTGDYLGKRLGKKRVTLWGLRPRQTAVLISVTTGVCIFLVAFSGILLANQNARRALLTYDQTVRRNRALKQANDRLNSLKQRLVRANQGLENDKHKLEREIEPLRQEFQKTKTHLVQTRSELRATSAELREKTQALEQVEAALNTVEKALNTTEAKLTGTEAKLTETKAKLTKTSARLAEKQKELTRGEDIVFKQYREIRELTEQREALQTEKQKLTAEVEQLLQERNVLKTIVEKLIQDKVIIGANEVIASCTIPAARDAQRVHKTLEQLLAEANRVASERGAKTSGEQERPLMLATRVIVRDSGRDYIREDQIVDRAADDIAQSGESVVVDVVAVRNFVAGEPVQAQLILYPNRLVFSKGDTLLPKEINSSQHKAGIFHDILGLLEEVRQVAAQQGVRPRKEHAYEDGTNQKIFDLLDRLSAQRGPVKVRVVAAKDLWTADQLSVRFEITTTG